MAYKKKIPKIAKDIRGVKLKEDDDNDLSWWKNCEKIKEQ